MLLWDLPGIAAGVRTLRSSRLAAIYNEIGPVLTVFAKLFGKALEAQVGETSPQGQFLVSAYYAERKWSTAVSLKLHEQ